MRKACIALGVLAGLIDLPWLFLLVPYKLFALLALLPPVAVLVLYCIFPHDITLTESKKETKTRASYLTLFTLSCIVPCLRSLMDFNILDWPRLLILAAIVLALLFAVLFLVTKEWRSRKSVIFLFFVIGAFYAVGLTAQGNFIFDTSDPTSQHTIVEEMRVSDDDDSPDYYLTLRLPDGSTEELEVDEDFYEQTALGNEVIMETCAGFLGVPYAYVR